MTRGGRITALPLGAIYGLVTAAAGALVAGWLRLGLPLPACPLRAATGLPCPTCGGTRVAEALLSADLLGAALLNPLLLAALTALAVWAVASGSLWLLRLPAPRYRPGPRARLALRAGALLALAAGWVWVIWRGV